MKALPVLTLLPLVLACGCTTTITREYRAGEEGRICEAALGKELASRDTNRLVYVAFRDSEYRKFDPPDAFLERLRASGIPARKASESSRDATSRVVDKVTGEPGAIYSASVLRWLNNSKVEAMRGYEAGNLAGGATCCMMKNKGGKWRETKITRVVTY
ncbi:MAG TPA: hypothetical protein VN578_11780 [Candidatus Binatia bacterium]|jgi:hypothetical protein|nr:hypothetical protein [Candidatus Binatia bacterium]